MAEIPELQVLFHRFGIALALGLFIGVEREMEKAGTFAGVRTFPLISMLGCLVAMLNELFIPWIFIAAFVILAGFVISAYFFIGSANAPGITTEISALLAFLFGALVWWHMTGLASALAVVTVLLLAAKRPLESLARRIGQGDLNAALQFAVITLIIFPVLPDKTYGPLQVINFRDIWLFVILIAGLNLIGYVLIKILGSQQGIGLAGLLGGIGSSTALAISFSRRSRSEAGLGIEFALGILLASTIMFIRVLILTFSINASLGKMLILPIMGAFLAGLLGCAYLWFVQIKRQGREGGTATVHIANPLELWQAIQFGVLFGVIIFIAKAAQVYFGATGVYLSSFLTGLTDVDAITLSLAKLEGSSIALQVAAHGIILAAITNTGVKALITATGSPQLRHHALPLFAVMLGVGLSVSLIMI
jgi:uncharacterized membrane protein (DUF4010 family)